MESQRSVRCAEFDMTLTHVRGTHAMASARCELVRESVAQTSARDRCMRRLLSHRHGRLVLAAVPRGSWSRRAVTRQQACVGYSRSWRVLVMQAVDVRSPSAEELMKH